MPKQNRAPPSGWLLFQFEVHVNKWGIVLKLEINSSLLVGKLCTVREHEGLQLRMVLLTHLLMPVRLLTTQNTPPVWG